MHSPRIYVRNLPFLLLAGFMVVAPISAQVKYKVIDLGTLFDGGFSSAYGINSSGQVAGFSCTIGNPQICRAFRTAGNSALNPATDNLGALASPYLQSVATAINNSGQVVGYAYADDGTAHGFRTAPHSPINPATDDLGFGGSFTDATAINGSGQVVGFSYALSSYGFRTGPNAAINPATDTLGNLGGNSLANGINASGQVVGVSGLPVCCGSHAFRTAPNSSINPTTDDLGTLGGDSAALGINSSGQVVGASMLNAQEGHAFRTAPNSPINPATDDLGTLGGSFSSAWSINASGQIVGDSLTSTSKDDAFIYDNGAMYDLNTLIPSNSGWQLFVASSINDSGQIVGWGLNSNSQQHAFRLDPLPTISLTIDIKPGKDPASINPNSAGSTAVAILSNPTFDAVTQIDQTSLTFGHTGNETSFQNCSTSDVNHDHIRDLVCNFNTLLTGFQLGDTVGILRGLTVDGNTLLLGTDTVRILNK